MPYFRKKKNLFWLVCYPIAVFAVYRLYFSLKTYCDRILPEKAPLNKTLSYDDGEKITEENKLRESSTHSTWSYTGNINYESEWH